MQLESYYERDMPGAPGISSDGKELLILLSPKEHPSTQRFDPEKDVAGTKRSTYSICLFPARQGLFFREKNASYTYITDEVFVLAIAIR